MKHQQIVSSFFLLFISILFAKISFSQQAVDTIYYDQNWSICEQPVAEYYRVCELNRIKTIFYKGPVTDYYLNGQIEMTGTYDSTGHKNGQFIFYAKDGKKIKEGNFAGDEAKGLWNFYNKNGILQVQFDCNSTTDFTPVLIVNNAGDTLLKNGNGKFIFNAQTDLPHIFPLAETYTLQGEVVNGQKDGEFNYNPDVKNKRYPWQEIYKKGKFIKSKEGDYNNNTPFKFLHIYPENLERTDNFYHSNIVFGLGADGDNKLISFLLNKETPEINSTAASYDDDIKDFYNIIGIVLRGSIKTDSTKNAIFSFHPEKKSCNLLSFSISLNDKQPRKIHDTTVLTIDTSGYVINSAFAGNFTQKEINEMNYYFSRLGGLKPNEQDGEKSLSNVTICVLSFFDTLQTQGEPSLVYYNYLAVNGDNDNSAIIESLEGTKQPATPVGGFESLAGYLERNLNSEVPIEHNAPNGNYTVTVSFLVDTTGSTSEVEALNDPGYGTAEEAVRVIEKVPKGFWIPAMKNGVKVAYIHRQKITFTVSGP